MRSASGPFSDLRDLLGGLDRAPVAEHAEAAEDPLLGVTRHLGLANRRAWGFGLPRRAWLRQFGIGVGAGRRAGGVARAPRDAQPLLQLVHGADRVHPGRGAGPGYGDADPAVVARAVPGRIVEQVLQRLVDRGNTILVIEHNLDVIKTADWLIDMGPEGGDGGGTLVAEGSPKQVSENAASYTGHYLKRFFE